ncbi:hypothetical protein [Flavobacterium sp. '19STA2R22 D10 B1']|uniref:hypothetical protein n=1 Tax=Flavobacterium aerium TaxID=3037261 RepID=UPI00278BD031|nr:hypothetical protein [Flavobacterium sp. '19STA2R22 D10 B1']
MKTKFIYFFLICFAFANASTLKQTKKTKDNTTGPIVVTVSIHLNKIYDINSVNQTYLIDAYLVLSWHNPKSFSGQEYQIPEERIIYENEEFPKNIAVPSFEFINILGNREIINRRLIINPNGQLTYNERFHGMFTTPMDFHKYPNDKQCFTLQLESFSLAKNDLLFVNPKLFPEKLDESYMEEWTILGTKDYVNDMAYNHLSIDAKKAELFSRCNFEIYAQRKIGYYLWKVILPIGILIVASWLVFWVKDFANQLSISFTLMLTMVTFNFYTSSLLPTLPYNTFIEMIIISGYISIFLTSIAIIFSYAYSKNEQTTTRINSFFRLFFPSLYLLYILLCIIIIFL